MHLSVHTSQLLGLPTGDMDLLGTIINQAVDGTTDLSSILRKCLVLASKLKNEKLKLWVLSELNGYQDKADLPEYRKSHVNSVGTFLGGFGAQLNDAPLPSLILEKQHREWADTAFFKQGIAAYEELSKENVGALQVPWPANIVALYQRSFYKDGDWALNRAHQIIPKTAMTALVSTVRNKLLEFALELQGEVGDAEPSPATISPAKVEGMVINIILGGQNNLSSGSVHGDFFQGVNQTVVKGDFASLETALLKIGLQPGELTALRAALDEDAKQEDGKSIGARATAWLKQAGKGALKVSGAVAEQVMAEAIRAYLGI